MQSMNISIFGMGYVGVVSAACLLRDGHRVVGVDTNATKVDDLRAGRSPIQEPGVAELLAAGHAAGRLRATTDPAVGVADVDMVWICVGTPSQPDGGINLDYVARCVAQIGAALAVSPRRPLIVLRSTVLPGTTRGQVLPTLGRASGLVVGRDIDLAFHPEFLREGCAVHDFDHPPKIVIGEQRPGGADRLLAAYGGAAGDVGGRYAAPRFRTSLEVAEMVKYSDNLFHAVKVVFANEVGALARAVGADAREVADIFCSDTKLNINPYYLRPGFAFGGSCLPKDLRAMLRLATLSAVSAPMLAGVLESNRALVDAFVARVLAARPRCVGLVGLAFKPNTDDMRESPYVAVAKRLIGEGLELRIYDPGVDPSRLIGANREAVLAALAHLERLLADDLAALDSCDLIVVNHPIVDASRVAAWCRAGKRVLDTVGIKGVEPGPAGYEGIFW